MKICCLFFLLILWVNKAGFAQTTTENYVLSHTYRTVTATPTIVPTELSGNVFAGTTATVQTHLSYLDGLGKPKLNVAVYSSPSQINSIYKDIVLKTTYDALQRPQYTYLPATPALGEGKYGIYYLSTEYDNRSDGAYRANVAMDYYNNAANVCSPTAAAYVQTLYEASPLSRASEQAAPGISAGAGVRMTYKTNNSSEYVYWYEVNTSNGLATNSSSQFYPTNTLNVAETLDESNNTVREYRDRYNRLVLKKVKLSDTENLDTYYVYDQKGQLRFVLQPQYQSEPNLDKFAFQYTYDNQGRMTAKRVPGTGGATNLYYDTQDQLIQSTDAKGQNFYYDYDALNRPVKTRFGSNDVSYTYYDGYSFTPFQNFTNEFSLGATDFVVDPQTDFRKELGTGSNTRLLNSDGTLGNWLQSVTYYDNKYRLIQTIRQLNGLGAGAYERVSYKYDFKGNVLTERTTQSANGATYILEKNYTYDQADRLLSVTHKLYEGSTLKKDYTHLTNTYNEVGQLAQKSLHSGIQTLTYKYTPRGWVCSINKTAGQNFSVGLDYKPNGNINTLSWGTANNSGSFSTITYDGANRLLSAEGDAYKEKGISYDRNGNIRTLQRIQNGTTIDDLYYNENDYAYDGNRLMRVRDASGNSGGFADNANIFNDYAYDNNGNLTQDLNKGIQANGIVYNALNLTRNVTINGQTVSYIYDAAGNKRQMNAPNGTTIYEGAFEYFNGTLQRIGLEEGQLIRNSNATYTVNYYLKDHLGNVRQVINDAGTVLQETEYYAFGMPVVRSGAANNKYLYNGKELQPNTGWLDYGARMYDGAVGRFFTVDALAEQYYGLSGYNYVSNNPLIYIDPNGREIVFVANKNGKSLEYTYHNGNFYHDGKRYNPGKESISKIMFRILEAYRKVEKSDDKEMKGILHALENSKTKHYMYANNNGNNEVHGEYEIVWDKQKGPIEGKLLYTKTLFDLDKKGGNDFKGIGKTDMTTVVHEMRHQYDHEIGNTGDFLPGSNEKDPAEIRAVYLENKARDIEGLKHRTKYGDVIDPKKLKSPPNNKMPEQ